VFSVPKLDCPTEERLIRMALADLDGIDQIEVDLSSRQLEVRHRCELAGVVGKLEPLGLGAVLVGTEACKGESEGAPAQAGHEGAVLRLVLGINALMFIVELSVGWVSESTGLIADSLDMLADAMVYAVSLYAVGRGARQQYRAATLAGTVQLVLGLGVLVEVGRRVFGGSDPVSLAMMVMAAVALVANLACAKLLQSHRHRGAHMEASWIFTTTDALANLGVVIAGALVMVTGSAVPDMVIATAIAVLVLRGAVRILRLPKPSREGDS
jgi:Co/Zn/Cd efflux system component